MIGSGYHVAGPRQLLGQKDGLRPAASPAVRKQDQRVELALRRRSIERNGTSRATGIGMQGFFLRSWIPDSHLWSARNLYNPEADTASAGGLSGRADCRN